MCRWSASTRREQCWRGQLPQGRRTQETFSHLQMQAARGDMDQLADLYLSDVKVSCECRRPLVRPESAAHYKTPIGLPTRRNLSTFISTTKSRIRFRPFTGAMVSRWSRANWTNWTNNPLKIKGGKGGGMGRRWKMGGNSWCTPPPKSKKKQALPKVRQRF